MSESSRVVVLTGGTGGAKLARGMLDVVDSGCLTVIANTGDDIEIYGAHVSPDPDLVTFWLADMIDTRGWGIDGDSFRVMDGLRDLGDEIWFNLGDRDLAIGIVRSRALSAGARQTEAHLQICRSLGLEVDVLPMSDRPVRTRVLADSRWWSLQEYMITGQPHGQVDDVQFHGAQGAGTTPEVLGAIANADAIVLGPSNPVISIGPMLAIEELREALVASSAPVVAVSPLVAGEVLKGPTAAFMRHQGVPVSADGIATLYEGVIDGLIADEALSRTLPLLETDMLMGGAEGRRRLASETLEFALTLSRSQPGN